MKNFPGTRTVIALTAAAIVVLLVVQACAPFIDLTKGKFGLVIRFPARIISKQHLETVTLPRLRHRGVSFHLNLVGDNGEHSTYDYGPRVAIKTDKVYVTELAQSLPKDGLTPIGSSLTHHLYSANAEDIATLLKELVK